ncbi:MAG TPA: helix-turn-helix domain-containing protein [Acidobacteriaceae bacterium]|nr:helix-turn-helix domain-containing protein [Terriglobia bacterium]HVC89332.1 helix-turn-helix domain-containing protein [Acidobacteriaceae bacterium]
MTAGTTSMEHFGEALRCERQRRSVSLEDIAQTTKVTVRSLQALESEAFDQLPGGILSKGIVRSYVRCLGLNESEWVERFLDASGQKSLPIAANDRDWAAFALNVSSTRDEEIQNPKLRWAGVVGLLLLLAGLGWAVWGYVHQRMTASTISSATHYAASFVSPTQATPRVEPLPIQNHHHRSHSLP